MSNVGRRNVYTCASGHRLITVDRDEGTTPFVTRCRTCGKVATSGFYTSVKPDERPTHEWYRAKDDDVRLMGFSAQDHHQQGGLFLREIGGIP